MTTARVWFITGASRGLGRAFTEAALAAGDRVVAAARNTEPLAALSREYPDTLVPLALDVSDRRAVFDGVERAAAAFGRLDIVVNNAGGLLYGMVEEATEEQIRSHLDVNFFGAVWVAQAVLPHMRAQGSGRILQITSMGAAGGMASVGFYGAGKVALDSVSEALAMEVVPLGIKVTIVEMGATTPACSPRAPRRRRRSRTTRPCGPSWPRCGATRPGRTRARPPPSSWNWRHCRIRPDGSSSATGPSTRSRNWSRAGPRSTGHGKHSAARPRADPGRRPGPLRTRALGARATAAVTATGA